MQLLTDPQTWVALATLTSLEIVLGIDNVVFISILAARLPQQMQQRARRIGLGIAMIMRILLLLSLAFIVRMTAPLVRIFSQEISGRDLVLLLGGLFLITKSTHEIHIRLEGSEGQASNRVTASLAGVLVQIVLLDIVFSLDSVITAVGMVDEISIMVAAIVLAVGVMLVFADAVSAFVERHPTVKVLALSFLMLIGVALIADGLDLHIPKGYIYFAMAFSLGVEMVNLRVRKPARGVAELRKPFTGGATDSGPPDAAP